MTMTSAFEAKPSARQHKKPCHDCPWRRKAIPGWLGAMDIGSWLRTVHGNGRVSCHALKQKNNEDWQCAGAAIFRSNICKLVPDPKALALPSDKINVFSWNDEFEKHHRRKK